MIFAAPKNISAIIALLISCMIANGQTVEIQGNLRVTEIDTISYGDTLVLAMPDGTLVIRSAADVVDGLSLKNNIIQYFLTLPDGISGLLDLGEDLEDLYAAGASLGDLLDAGISLDSILASGIPIDSVLAQSDLTVDSLLALYNPLQLFDFGLPLDSLYGKIYTEGYIFFLDIANVFPFDGLVCGLVDIGQDVNWGCSDMSIVTDTTLGSDPSNMSNILAAGCIDVPEASNLCAGYNSGTYDDWILPAKQTLNLMYQNLQLNGLGGFTPPAKSYCSSSQGSSIDWVWVQDYPSGLQSEGPKSMALWEVRPVRAFHD